MSSLANTESNKSDDPNKTLIEKTTPYTPNMLERIRIFFFSTILCRNFIVVIIKNKNNVARK